jgi:hypothetical protein
MGPSRVNYGPGMDSEGTISQIDEMGDDCSSPSPVKVRGQNTEEQFMMDGDEQDFDDDDDMLDEDMNDELEQEQDSPAIHTKGQR